MVQTFPVAPLPASAIPGEWDREPLAHFAATAQSALVVANRPLGIICALIRRGCTAAVATRPNGKPDGDSYDLMVVQKAADLGAPDAIVARAVRWLTAGGRLVIGHVEPATRSALASRLRLNGFIILRGAAARSATMCAERRRFPQ